MKVLLIGGCGYAGSALFEHLESFCYVDTIDLEIFGNPVNPGNLKVDYRNVSQSVLDKYDAIVLLAGHSSVQMSKDRFSTFRNNVANFVELLDKIDEQKFIYMSSSSVYNNIFDADEDDLQFKATNYYDLSKLEIDQYALLSGKNYYGLRLGTINGYSKNLRTDVMINKMYFTVKSFGKLKVWNKEVLRPILGIKDLCLAVSRIIVGPELPGIYNLSSFNASVGDIAQSVGNYFGIEVEYMGAQDSYNFSISSEKFKNNFEFGFSDTVETILNSLETGYPHCIVSERGLVEYV